jgi:hypothetical protein
MPRVFGRKPLSFKNMAEMSAAIGAHDFHSFHAERNIGVADDSARNLVVERRPAAAAVKFVGRLVQRGVAASADVRACGFVVPIFASEGAFGAFLGNYILLFWREGIPIFTVVFHIWKNSGRLEKILKSSPKTP